ncbi:phosphonate C-P lyase system protein PhnH [Rubrobacter tropicus]|uniref:phosphonate C-P lyase system protein PhnH n=1 Tax=Rubrobacter tropicus TaxID=2653851 RepID=UPI00140B2BB7|nr:phosphonate C-P lyase system protein PhnH [Rubrobacter tropicus]
MSAGVRTFDPVFDSQRVFRCVLQATAQPGKLFALPPTGVAPREAVARTLLDHEVTLCALGDRAEEAERISGLTGSRIVPVNEADFVLVSTGSGAGVSSLKRGTLERPETGATAIFAVRRLSNTGTLTLKLSGPGIRGGRSLGAEGLSAEVAEAIRESRQGYPLGVDVYLVDEAGQVAGLPRSTSLEVA